MEGQWRSSAAAAAAGWVVAVALVWATALMLPSSAGDPFAYFDWDVSYITASPLGVPQKMIAIAKQFPGPIMNITTNWNVVVNVLNSLDEPVLLTWDGIQHRKNCWQDGVMGTNCPIPPGWNWTFQFQVKDQIGSFFYFPSLGLQRAAGGYGGITVNNREVIAVPFRKPDGDITLFIGDWYIKNHTDLRKALDDGKDLGMPDGVLMNGKGPYRYNTTLVPDGIDYETINVEPGKTYRFRVHNVGISTSLNFRIQIHNLLLVETEGSYTVQQNYTNLDIHVGQSYSFLVTMDQNASSDYYIVASARFVNESLWSRVTGVAILHYPNSEGMASGPLPDSPNDFYDKTFSMNQARSIRSGVYTLDFPTRPLNRPPRLGTSVINGTYKGFMEIIFQNNDTMVQTYHMDGYAFFVVGMDYGEWTENSRGTYNKWDGVSRCTTQVFPGAWTAVLVSLDSVGFWNVRVENLDTWYLGQEVYVRVVNPEDNSNRTELPMPDSVLYCGLLKDKQKYGSRFLMALKLHLLSSHM
ncbi:hypothetical protein C4D60_Mb01t23070 [Musa balbisiana]|uniref:Monocopper oxidase-like protein SKU5 n=1 Tax=Musa balbisiana TaxID=52838 RepID=A0A4V4H7J6_MUSBA|nr:hypothetical protein C4D60_Mb01t23070 [Musa balbisiana]